MNSLSPFLIYKISHLSNSNLYALKDNSLKIGWWYRIFFNCRFSAESWPEFIIDLYLSSMVAMDLSWSGLYFGSLSGACTLMQLWFSSCACIFLPYLSALPWPII